jgi:cytoskeletal protein CcmA (bactofilin family)
MAIQGDVDCVEDVVIEGRIVGQIWNEHHMVTIAADAVVTGDIVARVISVSGVLEGTMVATDRVDIRQEARVTGRVLSQRLMIAEGAIFSGRVEPQHLDAALQVARHRRTDAANPARSTP